MQHMHVDIFSRRFVQRAVNELRPQAGHPRERRCCVELLNRTSVRGQFTGGVRQQFLLPVHRDVQCAASGQQRRIAKA